MNYQTYKPNPDLSAVVNFYWTLEVPYDPEIPKQKIIPDGNVEMTFNFADGIKKFVSDDEFIVHPDVMVMGQRTKSYLIAPTGDVNTFAISFFPYGFANLLSFPLKKLTDNEIPLSGIFGEEQALQLENDMKAAENSLERIKIIEDFLLAKLQEKEITKNIVSTTIDALIETNGNATISKILKENPSKRRQLERKFSKEIGVSPKQLGKVLRMQAALQLMLNENPESLTHVAYETGYYDQAHFIKDFKEFTEISPGDILENKSMILSNIFYKE